MAENSNGIGNDNNEGEIEYESDPEESKLSLKARRREASDDEGEDEAQHGIEDGMRNNQRPPRRMDVSDGESEGAVAEYDDALGEDLDYAEERELVEEEYGEDEYDDEYFEEEGGVGRDNDVAVEVERNKVVAEGKDGNLGDDGDGEDRKETVAEPFSVPKAGAFYMHDDRFGDSAGGGRNRRTIGGRRLWESRDDRKWGHDKFEELTTQERHHERRRGSRGRYRGRGRMRGVERRDTQATRGREYTNNITPNNKKQNDAPKSVRGRGPRRYQPSFKNKDEAPITQNKQSGEFVDRHSRASSMNSSKPNSNAATHSGPPRKQVASNLNVASPPFYPTGSSTKDNIGLQQDVQVGAINQSGQRSTMAESYNMVQSTSTTRGKNIVYSVGMEKLSIDDSNSAMSVKPSNTQMPLVNTSYPNSGRPQLRSQGRGTASSGHMAYQPVASNNNFANKVPSASQLPNLQRNPGQNHNQFSVHGSGQQFVQHMPGASQTFSPPKVAAGAVNPVESGVESASASSDNRNSLATKGRGMAQGGGKGSFLYGASQVMGDPGNIAGGRGDPNFPTFLPIMQFGGQHPGGIGVPAVGMAFPGYVGQPQHSRANSEMTWLPVLAGAAGALGSSYPPYITIDGSYNIRPLGQTSSAMSNSSNDNDAAKVGSEMIPAQRPDSGNEDFGQRQKNRRRYTEMKFNQS